MSYVIRVNMVGEEEQEIFESFDLESIFDKTKAEFFKNLVINLLEEWDYVTISKE